MQSSNSAIWIFRCLPTVKQGNLAQQIARALNKLPRQNCICKHWGGVTPPPHPPPGVTPLPGHK